MRINFKTGKFHRLIVLAVLLAFIFPAWLWMGMAWQGDHMFCPIVVMMNSDCPNSMGMAMIWHHFNAWQSDTMAVLVNIGGLFILAVSVISHKIIKQKEEIILYRNIGNNLINRKEEKIKSLVLAPIIHFLDLVKSQPAAAV